MTYDLIMVGGGLAGAALATGMAEHGAQVLVLERETRFRDRVRGDAMHPWGVAEARTLGLDDLLLATCAREVRWWRSATVGAPERPPRDLIATTPQHAGELAFYHPEMQEVLLHTATAAGAEVRRGVTVAGVTPGVLPEVAVPRPDGDVERLRARLVVGADGRTSRVRGWAGFTVSRDPQVLMVGGVLLRNLRLPEDAVLAPYHPGLGQRVLVFPLGAGRFRTYLIHRTPGLARRLSGRQHVPDFIAACIETGCDEAWFARAEAVGPLAMFAGADTWVNHPYRGGVVLAGDAAAASDPSWGCGLAQTLRDVRVLRDQLLATSDWEAAGHAYAGEHDRYYAALHRIETWLADLFYTAGPEADARRARVLPRLAREPGRAPDPAVGPDGPNEVEELRAFG